MQEIKKILPSSLAKYLSIVASMAILLSGILSLLLNLVNLETQLYRWPEYLINILVGTIFAYIVFGIIGYLFASLYNFLSSKTTGIIIETKDIDLELSYLKKKKELKVDKKEDEERFIV